MQEPLGLFFLSASTRTAAVFTATAEKRNQQTTPRNQRNRLREMLNERVFLVLLLKTKEKPLASGNRVEKKNCQKYFDNKLTGVGGHSSKRPSSMRKTPPFFLFKSLTAGARIDKSAFQTRQLKPSCTLARNPGNL